MKKHNLKGISFNLIHGDPARLYPPKLTFYRDTRIASFRAGEIAVLLVAAEVFRILDERKARHYVFADPGGPSIKFEMMDGIEPASRAAFHTIQNMEEILRSAVETLGLPEHDFAAARMAATP